MENFNKFIDIEKAFVINDIFDYHLICLVEKKRQNHLFITYNINNREKVLNILKENTKSFKKRQINNILSLTIGIIISIIFTLLLTISLNITFLNMILKLLLLSIFFVSTLYDVNIIAKIIEEIKGNKAIENNYLPKETKELKEKLYNSSKEINQALKEKITKSLTYDQKSIDNIKQKSIVDINELYNLINQDKEKSLLSDNISDAVVLKLKRK